MEAATWEPSENIEAGLLRFALFNGNNLCQMLCALLSDSEFDDPDPPEHIVRSHAAALYIELAKSLKADCLKHTVIRLPFRFDVFRFLFGSYNKKRLYFSDFNQRYFGPGWNQWFTDSVLGKHGHVIVFPLKAKLSLHRSPPNGFYRNSDGTFIPKPRPLSETLTVHIVKENAGE